MNCLSGLFRDIRSSSYFSRKLFEFELVRILLIIWFAVMVHWQYFIIKFYFRNQISRPSMKADVGTCACANSLDHMGITIELPVPPFPGLLCIFDIFDNRDLDGRRTDSSLPFVVHCRSRQKLSFLKNGVSLPWYNYY